MRPKSLILLALALGCGLVASIGISQVMESRRGQKSTNEEQTEILVALDDIERNAELSDKNVVLKPWPKAQVPAGAITKIEDVIGRRPNTRVFKEEPILEGKLGTGEGATRASGEIPPGFGTVPVRMDNSQNTGLILPGDRVDVQVFINKGPNVPQATTITFLEDVSVFAVNSEIRHDPATDAKIDAKTVSLLVTPEQAAKLTLAAEIGSIRLFLRGSKSEKSKSQVKITTDELLGQAESGSHQGSSQGTGHDLTAFLNKQPVVKPIEQKADVYHKVHRMVITHGTESHVEELHEGELLPRKTTLDGQPTTDGGSAPATSPADTAPSGDAAPPDAAPADAEPDSTPITTPAKPASANANTLKRVSD